MAALSPYDTQWLTKASFVPVAGRRRRVLLLAAALAAVAGTAIGAVYLDARGSAADRSASLARANAELAAELGSVRMALEVERATRAALEKESAALAERVSELTHQIEFLSSRGAPAPAGQVAARE
jgi:hypothetical protein